MYSFAYFFYSFRYFLHFLIFLKLRKIICSLLLWNKKYRSPCAFNGKRAFISLSSLAWGVFFFKFIHRPQRELERTPFVLTLTTKICQKGVISSSSLLKSRSVWCYQDHAPNIGWDLLRNTNRFVKLPFGFLSFIFKLIVRIHPKVC